MKSENAEYVDFYIVGEGEDMPSVALSAGGFCLQWSALPPGALHEMRAMLSKPCGVWRELRVGQLFGAALYFVEREGIFGFKAAAVGAEADLVRIDLSPALAAGLLDTLADAIELWED